MGLRLTATTTADTEAPSAPSDLTVLSVDQSKVLLRFTRGVDALGDTTHRMLVNGVASPNVAVLLTPGTFPRPRAGGGLGPAAQPRRHVLHRGTGRR